MPCALAIGSLRNIDPASHSNCGSSCEVGPPPKARFPGRILPARCSLLGTAAALVPMRGQKKLLPSIEHPSGSTDLLEGEQTGARICLSSCKRRPRHDNRTWQHLGTFPVMVFSFLLCTSVPLAASLHSNNATTTLSPHTHARSRPH